MIRYKLYQNKNSQSKQFDKWYARSIADVTLDTEALAEHMAGHNTPYSAGVIAGVLKDMIKCIKELVLDGKRVKLDNLAIFYVGLQSTSADTVKEFDVNKNVKAIRLRAWATGTLSSKSVKMDARLKEIGEYSVPSEDETEPTEPTV